MCSRLIHFGGSNLCFMLWICNFTKMFAILRYCGYRWWLYCSGKTSFVTLNRVQFMKLMRIHINCAYIFISNLLRAFRRVLRGDKKTRNRHERCLISWIRRLKVYTQFWYIYLYLYDINVILTARTLNTKPKNFLTDVCRTTCETILLLMILHFECVVSEMLL